MPQRNKHLQVFINGAVGFGIFATIALYSRSGELLDVALGLASGVMFGAGMAWFSSRTEKRLVAKGYRIADMSPTQERRIVVSIPETEALAVAQAAINSVPGIADVLVDQATRTISARVRGRFGGTRELMSVAVLNAPDSVVLKVRSEPRNSDLVIDDGAGIENVEAFVRALDARIVKGIDT